MTSTGATTAPTLHTPPPFRHAPWRPLLAALAIVVVLAVTLAVRLALRPASHRSGSTTGSQTTPPSDGQSGGSTTTQPSGGQSGGSATTPLQTPRSPTPVSGYLPLWPFGGSADASAWQRSHRAGGHQPWHLDAGMTAESFTRSFLGYREVDQVLGTRVSGREAWVSMGFLNPSRRPVVAAVVHLARLGSGSDAPWEVVGTRDGRLSLTNPSYGRTVSSPVTVGGRITGVDEMLRVQVRTRTGALVGQTGGMPAGGEAAPWSTTVGFNATAGAVLTIAVADGGGLQSVERFAITGVRAGTASTPSTGTASGQLADFFAAAQRLDRRLRTAATHIDAGITPTMIRVNPATVAAVKAADPAPVAAAIPAGLGPELKRRVLLVYSDLVSRRAAMNGVLEVSHQGRIGRGQVEAVRLLACLHNGAPAAARFGTDLATARALARASRPVVAAVDSPAAAELAVRIADISLRNNGCGSCGGYVATDLMSWHWTTLPSARTPGTGEIGNVRFTVTYSPGHGWAASLLAC